ncbi:MAG: hypothetical protein ACLSUL_10110 [[Ruminococcus] torques]
MKKNHNMQRTGQNCAAENVIVFSPTTCPSSEKKEKDAAPSNSQNPQPPKKQSASSGGGFLNFNLKKLTNLDLDHLLDSLLSDDLILIALIAVLVIERHNLKKNGADKNKLSDYDLTIMALLYIYF